jgi:hypothetical protein
MTEINPVMWHLQHVPREALGRYAPAVDSMFQLEVASDHCPQGALGFQVVEAGERAYKLMTPEEKKAFSDKQRALWRGLTKEEREACKTQRQELMEKVRNLPLERDPVTDDGKRLSDLTNDELKRWIENEQEKIKNLPPHEAVEKRLTRAQRQETEARLLHFARWNLVFKKPEKSFYDMTAKEADEWIASQRERWMNLPVVEQYRYKYEFWKRRFQNAEKAAKYEKIREKEYERSAQRKAGKSSNWADILSDDEEPSAGGQTEKDGRDQARDARRKAANDATRKKAGTEQRGGGVPGTVKPSEKKEMSEYEVPPSVRRHRKKPSQTEKNKARQAAAESTRRTVQKEGEMNGTKPPQ